MEWLRETQWLAWIGGALILGLVEVASLDLVFAMLALAALVAALAAFLGASFPVQVIAFVLASGLLLAVARPLALRKLKPAGPGERTGTAGQVGRRAEVLTAVTGRSGLVKLSGEQWTARSADAATTFEIGAVVLVVQIDGATAVVGPAPDPSSTSHPKENR